MVLVQIDLDDKTNKDVRQYMLNSDIEIKAEAVVSLVRFAINELRIKE